MASVLDQAKEILKAFVTNPEQVEVLTKALSVKPAPIPTASADSKSYSDVRKFAMEEWQPRFHKAAANPDEKADAQLGEGVEDLVERHFVQNKDAEAKEGHRLTVKSGDGAGIVAMSEKPPLKKDGPQPPIDAMAKQSMSPAPAPAPAPMPPKSGPSKMPPKPKKEPMFHSEMLKADIHDLGRARAAAQLGLKPGAESISATHAQANPPKQVQATKPALPHVGRAEGEPDRRDAANSVGGRRASDPQGRVPNRLSPEEAQRQAVKVLQGESRRARDKMLQSRPSVQKYLRDKMKPTGTDPTTTKSELSKGRFGDRLRDAHTIATIGMLGIGALGETARSGINLYHGIQHLRQQAKVQQHSPANQAHTSKIDARAKTYNVKPINSDPSTKKDEYEGQTAGPMYMSEVHKCMKTDNWQPRFHKSAEAGKQPKALVSNKIIKPSDTADIGREDISVHVKPGVKMAPVHKWPSKEEKYRGSSS